MKEGYTMSTTKTAYEYERDYSTDLKKASLLFSDYTQFFDQPELRIGFLSAMAPFIEALNDPIASAVYRRLCDFQGNKETGELYAEILQEHFFTLESENQEIA